MLITTDEEIITHRDLKLRNTLNNTKNTIIQNKIH